MYELLIYMIGKLRSFHQEKQDKLACTWIRLGTARQVPLPILELIDGQALEGVLGKSRPGEAFVEAEGHVGDSDVEATQQQVDHQVGARDGMCTILHSIMQLNTTNQLDIDAL